MTQVLSLYQEAEARRIPLFLRALPQTGSLSLLSASGQCYIALDPSLSDTQQRVRLAHELGHCETGSFYNRYSPYDLRERCEHRADRAASERLIPEQELDEAVALGNTQLWQLADWFGVDEPFMRKAVCLYTHGNLATELYF